jgi:hypothetical protein
MTTGQLIAMSFTLIITALIIFDIVLLVVRFNITEKKQEEIRLRSQAELRVFEAENEKHYKQLFNGRRQVIDSMVRMEQELKNLDDQLKS